MLVQALAIIRAKTGTEPGAQKLLQIIKPVSVTSLGL